MTCIHCNEKVYARGICHRHYHVLLGEVQLGRSSWEEFEAQEKCLPVQGRKAMIVEALEMKPIVVGRYKSVKEASIALGVRENAIYVSAKRPRGYGVRVDGKWYRFRYKDKDE